MDTAKADTAKFYQTAIAAISCAHFKAGEVVAVEFYDRIDGVNWFVVTANESREFIFPIAYPETHLHSFCY